LTNIPKPKPHIPSIDKTLQNQNSACLSSIRKTWKNLAKPKLGVPYRYWQKQTQTPSQYWQNLAKPGPSKPFEYWQNLAKPKPPLSSLGKTMQNQNHPFPVWAKPCKTKTSPS
jgi:hypothetical protein